MDTYGHKPSNDELLHDLMRVFGPPPTFAGAQVKFDTDELRARQSGPLERVMSAVDDYHADEANQEALNTSPDGDAYIGMYADEEHQAWRNLCSILKDDFGIDVNDNDKLCKAIEVWGALLVQLRMNQTPGQRRDAGTKAFEAWQQYAPPAEPVVKTRKTNNIKKT